MTNNTNTPKHIFNISKQDFFNAWKMTFERKLRETHEEQYEIAEEMQLEPISYERFCNTMFMTVPQYFETRDN